MDSIYTQLKQFGHVRTNVPLFKYTTFRIGGLARFLVETTETEKLVGLLNFLSEEGIEYFVLGGGSNVIFSDDEFEGVVIKIMSSKQQVSDNIIEAEAGVWLGTIVNLANQNSLSGMEWAAGIPGTVGGAVRGNAGAMGKDTASSISRVEVWRDGEILELSKQECEFNYRESIFKNNKDVVLRAWFELVKGDKSKILELVQKYLKQRQGKFPAFPSAGSFFKNVKLDRWLGDKDFLPELYRQRGTVPVGWLVEQVGMKGFGIGDAQVSEQHGNFIINKKSATQSDILAVVEKVKEAVYNKFGVELEEEVEIVK